MTALINRRGDSGARAGRRAVPSAGVVGRRRPLPNGRAVVGGFLVAAAATLVLAGWLDTTRGHGQRWVVAAQNLATGTRIAPGDLTTETMTLPAATTGAMAYRTAGELTGHVLAAPVLRGELVQRGALVADDRQPALRPVTVPLAASDSVDLSAGTLVDVLVTDGSDPGSRTAVVIRGATVLAVSTAQSSLLSSASPGTVTLGVATFAEVAAVVHAAHTGTLTVVVGERSDGLGLGAGR